MVLDLGEDLILAGKLLSDLLNALPRDLPLVGVVDRLEDVAEAARAEDARDFVVWEACHDLVLLTHLTVQCFVQRIISLNVILAGLKNQCEFINLLIYLSE